MSDALQENTRATKAIRAQALLSWLVGGVAAYFLTSFFSNFYPRTYQFIVLGTLFSLLCGATAFLFLRGSSVKAPGDPLAIMVLVLAFALSISALVIAWQFPALFPRWILFMDLSKLPFFVLLSAVSLGGFSVALQTKVWKDFSERLEQTRFFNFLRENILGVVLAMFFFMTYLVFAESINFPGFRTLDQFFDTDISEWLIRLTATILQDVSVVRPVHPAILIFLRPPIRLLSIFLNGDRLQAVFLLQALAGAACVLLMWLIVKRASGNATYSLITASLLGGTASHLLLSSMLETYIYSALALLFFTFLIQSERTSLRFTVPAGVLVLGITITNFIQTCILYLFNHPRLKVIIKYVLIVTVAVAALNLLQVWMYANAQSLFQPDNFAREGYYIRNPLEFSWHTIGRVSLIARAIPLYGVVAPTPFILLEELGVDVPNFRTYKTLLGEFHVAGYRGLADVTVKFWIVILAIAGILFLWQLLRSPKQMMLPLSLLLCIGFSFGLHIVYGDDPMLYSPNWVYALILFVALMLKRWADQRWLQILLILFFVMLMGTNLGLIYQIMKVSAPFYGLGN